MHGADGREGDKKCRTGQISRGAPALSAVMMLGLFLGCSTAKAITVVIPSGPDRIDKTITIMNPINGELATDLHAHLENAPSILDHSSSDNRRHPEIGTSMGIVRGPPCNS